MLVNGITLGFSIELQFNLLNRITVPTIRITLIITMNGGDNGIIFLIILIPLQKRGILYYIIFD